MRHLLIELKEAEKALKKHRESYKTAIYIPDGSFSRAMFEKFTIDSRIKESIFRSKEAELINKIETIKEELKDK